jgi:YbgC/YbaW family acyl-CoA thioester hydrolase
MARAVSSRGRQTGAGAVLHSSRVEPNAAPDLPSPSRFRYARRVQFAETDLAGIVHFSFYFRYMEEAEHALWRAAGLSIAAPDAPVGWPRVAAAFDYKSPLRFEDEFDVHVRITSVSRRTIEYSFVIRRGTTVIGNGFLRAACVSVGPAGMASVELPAGLVERLRAVIDVRPATG